MSASNLARTDSPISTSAQEVSWLAIRQPGIIRVLQDTLWSADGDAFAAGLELACRFLGELFMREGVPLPRIEHYLLERGAIAVSNGIFDEESRSWMHEQLAGLPVALTTDEENAVVTTLAVIVWAAGEVRSAGVDPDQWV